MRPSKSTRRSRAQSLYWAGVTAIVLAFSLPFASTIFVSCTEGDDNYVSTSSKRPPPARCPTPSDCPCDGPTDCPERWVCAIFTAGAGGFCLEVSGTECDRQADCSGDQKCTGLDCAYGGGAAGCGRGTCLENAHESCQSQIDCPLGRDICVHPGAISNSVCYREP